MRNRGFTLIELMIIVSILGILAAVVVPVMGLDGSRSSCEARGMEYSWWTQSCVDDAGIMHHPYLYNSEPVPGVPTTNAERVELFCGGPYASAVVTGSGMEYTCFDGSKVVL